LVIADWFFRNPMGNDGFLTSLRENSAAMEDFSLPLLEDDQELGVRMVFGENPLAMRDSRCGFRNHDQEIRNHGIHRPRS
jgi:hypothetical protein